MEPYEYESNMERNEMLRREFKLMAKDLYPQDAEHTNGEIERSHNIDVHGYILSLSNRIVEHSYDEIAEEYIYERLLWLTKKQYEFEEDPEKYWPFPGYAAQIEALNAMLDYLDNNDI